MLLSKGCRRKTLPKLSGVPEYFLMSVRAERRRERDLAQTQWTQGRRRQ